VTGVCDRGRTIRVRDRFYRGPVLGRFTACPEPPPCQGTSLGGDNIRTFVLCQPADFWSDRANRQQDSLSESTRCLLLSPQVFLLTSTSTSPPEAEVSRLFLRNTWLSVLPYLSDYFCVPPLFRVLMSPDDPIDRQAKTVRNFKIDQSLNKGKKYLVFSWLDAPRVRLIAPLMSEVIPCLNNLRCNPV
jgi:hypothetical protein